MRVINRRTVIISSNGAINAVDPNTGRSGNNFNEGIIIPFFVDEVIVRQISFGIAISTGEVLNLVSNLIPDQYLAILADVSTTQNLDNRYFINRSINGTYNFQVQTQNGALSTSLGQYSLLLEFVQYGN